MISISIHDMEKYGHIQEHKYKQMFGSWRQFLSHINESTKHCINNYTEKELIDNFNKLRPQLPRIITEAEFNKISPIFSKNYKNVFRGWGNFLKYVNEPLSRNSMPPKQHVLDLFKRKKSALGKTPKYSDFSPVQRMHIRHHYGCYTNLLDFLGEEVKLRRNKVDKLVLATAYFELKKDRKELPIKEWKAKSKYTEHVVTKQFGSWNNFKNFCKTIEEWD